MLVNTTQLFSELSRKKYQKLCFFTLKRHFRIAPLRKRGLVPSRLLPRCSCVFHKHRFLVCPYAAGIQAYVNSSLFQFMHQFNYPQLSALRLLSRRVEQTITYHCKNSPAWNEKLKQSMELVGFDGKKINMASPMFYKPRVLLNECNVSVLNQYLQFNMSPGFLYDKLIPNTQRGKRTQKGGYYFPQPRILIQGETSWIVDLWLTLEGRPFIKQSRNRSFLSRQSSFLHDINLMCALEGNSEF